MVRTPDSLMETLLGSGCLSRFQPARMVGIVDLGAAIRQSYWSVVRGPWSVVIEWYLVVTYLETTNTEHGVQTTGHIRGSLVSTTSEPRLLVLETSGRIGQVA